MIRFLTHILDIKNLLGMQRTPIPTPLPVYPANQFVMRSDTINTDVTPVFTGSSINLTVTESGVTHTYNFPSIASGTQIHITADPGTDIIWEGALQRIAFNNVPSGISFVALNDTMDQLYDIDDETRTLDLRNGAAFTIFFERTSVLGITELYARADTSQIKNVSVVAINASPDGGVLWIDRTQPYAADVIAAAEAHNWTIYDL